MNFRAKQKCLCTFFISVVLLSHFAPAIAMSVQQQATFLEDGEAPRAYNVKSSNVKKSQMIEKKQDTSQSNLKQKEDAGGFKWGNMLNMALKLLSITQPSPSTSAVDKMDTISQITSGDFSWTKIVTLGLQLILSFFGNDNVAIDKMDPGSPVEAFLATIIAYLTNSDDPTQIKVMAKQATELWDIVISLLDTLRTSFSQRSFQARAIGSNDLLADAAIASTSMVKSLLKTYSTKDDMCIQKYICEANKECADETGETGYIFCQLGSYALNYALEGKSYTPFDIISDAARMGRIGEDCKVAFKECKDNYF
ncbi:hypothetical protein Anas_00638 [Armadillidium nasatum]|uniref:Secreted protein n=1 Tax=Armadillidium nasatum TaxID=96803 RepID=A0A5N5TH97_9CRUS|nr:hypothetical protein Anas_00638 [Armadillidium nasatum]